MKRDSSEDVTAGTGVAGTGSERDTGGGGGKGRGSARTQATGSGKEQGRLSEGVLGDLEAQAWFHGMVTRDDIPLILSQKGDFLVRISQVDPNTDEMRIVLSVLQNPGGSEPIKHFVILHSHGGFYLLHDHPCPTVSGLIAHHLRDRIPLDERKNGPILLNGVARAEWELEHEEVELRETLGKGAFGEVRKGLLHVRGRGKAQEVAVKLCHGNSCKEQRQAFMKEARIMRLYDHRNVIKLYGVAAGREPLYIVMELAGGGSLLAYLRKTWPSLHQEEKLRLILDVARGMEYLEKKGCIHRDLAARNCLLDKACKTVKIADFGLSSVTQQGESQEDGLRLPIKWTAPEALKTCKFTSKSDVWSYGILITEVWSGGGEPYPGKTLKEIKKGIHEGLRSPIPPSTPPQMSKLINRCWEGNPYHRPSFRHIREYLSKL